MERLLDIDNGIYYSLGFTYLINYNWKYNLIFDIKYLKELVYYKNNINFHCYKAVIDYWYKNDSEYLKKLARRNKICDEVINKYYKTKQFDFWRIEKETFETINKHKNQKIIKSIIKKVESSFYKKFPASLIDAKKAFFEERTPEMIGLKDNNLLKNKYFLGFYINKKIPKKIMKILKKKYSNKILFNGVKITKI